VDGILYDKNVTSFVRCPEGRTGNVTIAAGVTTASGSFSGSNKVTSVTIPPSMTFIRNSFFMNCTGLTTVTIPPEVTRIYYSAFNGCTHLVNVTIPAGVTRIENSTFEHCRSLKSITLPDHLDHIGNLAFADCISLTHVTIPATLTTMGNYVFQCCPNLSAAYFEGDAPYLGVDCFKAAASDFCVYFYHDATGFTTPLWNGYNAINMGTRTPVIPWLVANGLPYNTNMQEDADHDGILNLLEYAFGTNPTASSTGQLQYTGSFPGGATITATGQPAMAFESSDTGGGFRALFMRRVDYATAKLAYTVEFSSDLSTWTASSVVPVVLATDGTYQIVSVPYPAFVGGKEARFFRVGVASTP
jgi:hypothetical protein